MWLVKAGVLFARGRDFERHYVENEFGTKVIFLGLEGHVKDGVEAFEYQEADLHFEFFATRVNDETGAVDDLYTVWLGGALNIAEHALAPHVLAVDRARAIARNIKEALLVWRFPGKLADIFSCHSPATGVAFNMNKWRRWDAALESDWP
jgi:hypothetical protein